MDPEGVEYVEVPYRMLSNPAVSMWEHRQALARLRERGADQVDEAALFRMINQMCHIAETAEKTTKRTRREAERRQHAKNCTDEGDGATNTATTCYPGGGETTGNSG